MPDTTPVYLIRRRASDGAPEFAGPPTLPNGVTVAYACATPEAAERVLCDWALSNHLIPDDHEIVPYAPIPQATEE